MVAQKGPGTALDTPRIDWSEVTDLASAQQILLENGAVVVTDTADLAGIIGDGFTLMNDKSKLVGIPHFILEWATYQGSKGSGEFVTVRAMLSSGEKIVYNDGSTGIMDQLHRIEMKRMNGAVAGLKVPVLGGFPVNGLRASTYEVEVNGKMTEATTFYLS